jgi:hypothetical protein
MEIIEFKINGLMEGGNRSGGARSRRSFPTPAGVIG